MIATIFYSASNRSAFVLYKNFLYRIECLFIYLLASERIELDTYRGNTIENHLPTQVCLDIISKLLSRG